MLAIRPTRSALTRCKAVVSITLLSLTLSACATTDGTDQADAAPMHGSSLVANIAPLYCERERAAGTRIKRMVCLTEMQLRMRAEDSKYLVESARETSRLQSVAH